MPNGPPTQIQNLRVRGSLTTGGSSSRDIATDGAFKTVPDSGGNPKTIFQLTPDNGDPSFRIVHEIAEHNETVDQVVSFGFNHVGGGVREDDEEAISYWQFEQRYHVVLNTENWTEVHLNMGAPGGERRRPLFFNIVWESGTIAAASEFTTWSWNVIPAGETLEGAVVQKMKLDTTGLDLYGLNTNDGLRVRGNSNQNLILSVNNTTGLSTILSTIDSRGQLFTNGAIHLFLGANNGDTYIQINADNTYTVSHPEAFRTAIGAAAAT